jgi:hypothetical protein
MRQGHAYGDSPLACCDCALRVLQGGGNGRESWECDANGDAQQNGRLDQSDTQGLSVTSEHLHAGGKCPGYPCGFEYVCGYAEGKEGGRGDAQMSEGGSESERGYESRGRHRVCDDGIENVSEHLSSANDDGRPRFQYHAHETLLHENASVHPAAHRVSHDVELKQGTRTFAHDDDVLP